jgi:hypothetical protein
MITVKIPQEIAQRLQWKDNKKMDGDPDQIMSIDHPKLPCEDCDKLVAGRTIDIKGSLDRQTYPHFAWYCNNCKMFKDPVTQKYTIKDRREIRQFFKR